MTERVLVDSDATITGPVFTDADETAADTTSTPTVTAVSRVSGETLTAPSVTALAAAGAYTADLTAAAHTAELDVIDLTWTGTVAGKTRTYSQTVEVVGGFYDSIPSLRTITSLASRPVAQLRKYRAEIEDKCEEARGTAYVPRCAIETFTSGPVRLRHRHVQRILSITVDGTTRDVADYEVDPITRTVTTANGGIWFTTDVVIAYVHGYLSPPAALVEACREFVRAKVTIDSADANRNPTSVTNLATQEIYRFGTADPKYGRWTGLESVDSRINSVTDERVLIG